MKRDRTPAHANRPTAGLGYAPPSGIERWFAAMGTPACFDLARSGAPARSVADLLAIATSDDVEEYLGMSLDYGPGIGSERLRTAISASLGCDAPDVVVTNGAVEALLLACSAVIGDRRNFAVATPAYEGLFRAVQAAGGTAHGVRAWSPGTSDLDLAALGALDLHRYAAVVLNSPHNPTGLCVDPFEFANLAERCASSGTVLIVDQVSVGTLDAEGARSIALAAQACPVLVIGDVSKAYGLGGLRVGWCASRHRRLLSMIASLRDLTTISVSRPAQLLAAIALENRERLSIAGLARSNLQLLEYWMQSVGGASLVRPSDGLVAFCGLGLARSSVWFSEMLRERSEVSVTPGAFFGHDRHLRIGLGVHVDEFAEGVRRIVAALENEPEQLGSGDREEHEKVVGT